MTLFLLELVFSTFTFAMYKETPEKLELRGNLEPSHLPAKLLGWEVS
jgi:hypothetical protein